MKHSELVSASQQLAAQLFGTGATAQVTLMGSGVLSAVNPALRFRFGFRAPGQTGAQLLTMLAASVGVTGGVDSLSVLRAAERGIARGCNSLPAWADLGMGMAHIVTGSVAIAADGGVLLFDYRCQPPEYQPDF